MKKFFLVLCLLVIVSGCVADKAVFRETSKFNYLTLGSYEIGIDKRFTFLGEIDSSFKMDNIDDPQGSNIKTTRYLFVDATNGKSNVDKGIVVFDLRLKNPQHYFRKEAEYKRDNMTFSVGYTNAGNVKMAYRTIKVTRIADDILKFGRSKGYNMASSNVKYGTGVQYAKNIGRSRQMVIMYGEIIEDEDTTFQNSKFYISVNK